ncbi:CdaR family transcriptional regulator [Conexibacter sp. SYSU D00693]|uniref:PucR family transcriptional regulator n=1 Tax=Conexibacter sp. SYSU D00693 TaxID=2812560 RepID=UPI00196B99E4|nr:helix-turn-helix domain-containing protein [Conexibacter sp. SYSU D00693]
MIDLSALEEITEAVERGAGLPEVVRAAARALDASIVLSDRSGAVLAVAARSQGEERALLADGDGTEALELRVADEPVGTLRLRVRGDVGPGVLRLVTTLIASEVERLRAPERASEEAVSRFISTVLSRDPGEREELLARGADLGVDLASGATVVVARAHAHAPEADGWRERVLRIAERGARAATPGAIAALSDREETLGAEVVLLVPGAEEEAGRRTCEAVLREMEAGLPAHTFALGHSRPAGDVLDLARAGNEALLAANVAEGETGPGAASGGEDGAVETAAVLAFDETGAYRLLLSAMAEDPAELQRFYAETVEALVAYDEQYETDLVLTVEAFLDADGNVAGTAQRLFTHRHTIRYRLERVRELTGLDVGSTDGREKLSLGLKAMRVLGIAARGGPASERGAGGGRVPRRS